MSGAQWSWSWSRGRGGRGRVFHEVEPEVVGCGGGYWITSRPDVQNPRAPGVVERGDLTLERWQPESLHPVVRHVANKLWDELGVDVDTEASHPP